MNRMKYNLLPLFFFFFFPVACFAQKRSGQDLPSAYNIIPRPVSIKVLNNKPVTVDKATMIVAGPQFYDQAVYLQQQLEEQCGLKLSVQAKAAENTPAIILNFDNLQADRPGMYLLTIKNDRIAIGAKDVEGAVHGIQTLLQLLPLRHNKKIRIAPVEIEDYPRFRYRGMHLDVSRHFFPVSYIKKYIDYLTFHKFNSFHWHLTDDQGWRIEIKNYPKLTEVGAWRDSTLVGHFRDTPARYDGIPHGGFYTQEEVKDIIRYADVRGISIIPEIDIPGHSRATIASYPELSTSPDTAWQVGTAWGMYNRKNNVLAPNEKTFAFLKTVFGEIADLFPSPYIHVGGDECSKIWWKADPKTQAFMKEHGLKDETALQTYFIQQVINDLKQKGKKVIGWDEILEGGLDTSAIIMNWRGVKAAIEAAKKNHRVIMTPGPFTYLNYAQTKSRDSLTAGGYLPLDKVYGFEPVPKELNQQEAANILGAQGNVWTEYIPYESKIEYMIFPRMTALSEVLWTQAGKKDFTDFKKRLKENAVPRYQFWNSNYCKDYEYWTLDK
jgi:hexosaminidase